jgi:hypothetical protein
MKFLHTALRRLGLFFIFLFGIFLSEVYGVERFVAKCVNNGNGLASTCAASPGSTGAYNTIQDGVNAAAPGDIITVLDGTYDTGGTPDARVQIDKGGTSSNQIIIRSKNKHKARVDGKGEKSQVFFIRGSAQYITIDGFDVFNGTDNGFFIRTSTVQGIGDGGGFIKIINNKIHNNGNTVPCDTMYGYSGIFEDAHDTLIKGNEIYNNGRIACTDGTIHASWPHSADPSTCCLNHHDHGIYLTGPNPLIQENIIYGNASYGIAEILHKDAPGLNGSNPIIRNNVFYNQKYRGGIFFSSPGVFSDTRRQAGIVENNIIYNHTSNGTYIESYAIWFYNTGSAYEFTVRNNLFFGNKTNNVINNDGAGGLGPGRIIELNNLIVDPLFVNTVTFDFHLQTLSPARGTGFGGVDLGAYPQGGIVGTNPSPPTGLKVIN